MPHPDGGEIVISKDQWDLMLTAFREAPGHHTLAAQAADVDRKTAVRAWEEGWSDTEYAKRPIKSVIAIEQARIRADMTTAERGGFRDAMRESLEASMTDLVASRALQGRIVRKGTGMSLASMQLATNLIAGGLELSKDIGEALKKPNKLTLREQVRVARDIQETCKLSLEVARHAQEMERRALGEIDLFVATAQHMTEDECITEILESAAMLERAANRGAIDVEFFERAKRETQALVPPTTPEGAAAADERDEALLDDVAAKVREAREDPDDPDFGGNGADKS